MRIEGSNSALTNLRNLKNSGGPVRAGSKGKSTKSLGETPPQELNLGDLPKHLAALFHKGGLLSKLQRKLNRLKKKKNFVVPAKSTTACINDEGKVYVGIEFLDAILQQENAEETIAGVLAHEWGHSCAERPKPEEVESLSWNEIFALRRSHETLADEISGRLLALMGYKPDGLLKFLFSNGDTHNLKYHNNNTRAQVIVKGFQEEKRKMHLAKELFPNSIFHNDHTSRLLDDDI